MTEKLNDIGKEVKNNERISTKGAITNTIELISNIGWKKDKKPILIMVSASIYFCFFMFTPRIYFSLLNHKSFFGRSSDISHYTQVCQTKTNLFDRSKRVEIQTNNKRLLITQLMRKKKSISEDKKRVYSEITIKLNSLDLDVDVVESFMKTVFKIAEEINKRENLLKLSESSKSFNKSSESGKFSGFMESRPLFEEKQITNEYHYDKTTSLLGPYVSDNDLKIILNHFIQYLIKNFNLRGVQETSETAERVSEPLTQHYNYTPILMRSSLGDIFHGLVEPSMQNTRMPVPRNINETTGTTSSSRNNPARNSSILRKGLCFVLNQLCSAGLNYSFNLLKRLIKGD
uniref:Uncharacterized protein n=1 Tax=Psilotum nudum TaxID=3240 RepID=Q8WHX0_PSINU|nr:hypothetical protein PsnuCp089 [Psilotum nudum]BAB84283.1 hypothetical protein [Psilotum nudum]|eukprot:c8425_g1_i1 orf=244-1278(+)